MTSRRDNRQARSRLFQAEAERDVKYLLERLQDPRDRFMTGKFLGALKAREAVPALIPLLRAGDKRVRSSAAEALANIGATEAVPELIDRVLVEEEEVAPRTWAIIALWRLGDERALEPPCTLLFDEDIDVRRAAAKALGVLGHPGALEPLRSAAAKEKWHKSKKHNEAIKTHR